MAGVAPIMIADQLRRVTGVPVTGQAFFAQLDSFARGIGRTQPTTVAVAAAVLAFLLHLLWWRWPHALASLLAVLLATAAVTVAGLRSHGVGVVGPIPAGLPVPGLPDLHPQVVRELLLPAFTVLIVAFSDDVLITRSFARRGEKIIANRELLALGVANAGSSLVRGFPVSSSATRTAIGVATGSRTQLYSLTAAASVVAVLLFLRPVLSRFPTAALGAIVVYAAIRLIDLPALRRLYAFRRAELALAGPGGNHQQRGRFRARPRQAGPAGQAADLRLGREDRSRAHVPYAPYRSGGLREVGPGAGSAARPGKRRGRLSRPAAPTAGERPVTRRRVLIGRRPPCH
jgi:sulfate permease, SulP family